MIPPGSVTERNSAMVVVLSFVTCMIYGIIWKYQVTDELRNASGDQSINPMTDLLLSFVTCGIWAMYSDYRNAKKIYEMFQKAGVQRSDQSTIVILLWIFGLSFIGIYILQEEFNALAKLSRGERV